jgi:hypothetical protein
MQLIIVMIGCDVAIPTLHSYEFHKGACMPPIYTSVTDIL